MPRRISVDWAGLEVAFTWQSEESAYFDIRSGKVGFVQISPQEGGGLEGEEDVTENMLSEMEVARGVAEGRLLPIDPLTSSEEYKWMVEFAESVTDPRLRELLEAALEGPAPFRRFKAVLAGWPEERARWLCYRDESVYKEIRRWLARFDLEPANDPPG